MRLRKILNISKNPKYILAQIGNKIHIYSNDEFYLKAMYKYKFGKKLNLKKPRNFNEKLQWLKLYDRNQIYTNFVDKCLVKEYVTKTIGKEYIIPNIGIYKKYSDINFDSLPIKFVIKCNHDSHGLVMVDNKNEISKKKIKRKINKSLKRNYYYAGREWPYKNVNRMILIEKYMGENLNDYKIFCFNGTPKYILVCSNRKGKNKNTDFYDIHWNLMPFSRANHNNSEQGIEKPKELDKMLEIAKKLSNNIPFVRVDLYDINGKVYFGELTFYPSSGFEGFNPEFWDEKLGNLLNINMVRKYEK